MRKTSLSAKCCSIIVLSSRAEARSWPNGFSMTSRVQPVFVRHAPIAWTTPAIPLGGIAR